MMEYQCIKEDQLVKQEVDIAELKTRVDYKHQRIDELKQKIEEMDKKLDKIDGCLSKLEMESKTDDFNIDNRLTKVENTLTVLKWVSGIGLSIIGTAVAVLGFIMTVMH